MPSLNQAIPAGCHGACSRKVALRRSDPAECATVILWVDFNVKDQRVWDQAWKQPEVYAMVKDGPAPAIGILAEPLVADITQFPANDI